MGLSKMSGADSLRCLEEGTPQCVLRVVCSAFERKVARGSVKEGRVADGEVECGIG